jgi:glycine cleavage system transcriptional repressor
MRADIVFTLTGPDRVGIVEEVTGILLKLDGNVETSRMARLGGEFAILALVAVPAERRGDVESAFRQLTAQGYKLTVSETVPAPAEAASRLQFLIDVTGADHEGIIHNIARIVSLHGINIESLDTGTSSAPVSATPLFSMKALIAVPRDLADPDWQDELTEAALEANVDVTISPVEG